MKYRYEYKRIFKGIVWIGENPAERFEYLARDSNEAVEMLKEQYGSEAKYSLWNEEDANKIR